MPVPSLFVWNPRTGGTSLWVWLCEHGGQRIKSQQNVYYFAGLNCMATMHWQYDVWRRYIDYHGAKRLVFGFYRDTFTRLESIAAYRGWDSLERFVAYLERGNWVLMPKYHPRMNFAAPQSRWLAADGRLAVNFLGRQESLEEGFRQLCRLLGWPQYPLGRENAKRRTFTDGWTSQMREIVGQIYQEDFRLMGSQTNERIKVDCSQ